MLNRINKHNGKPAWQGVEVMDYPNMIGVVWHIQGNFRTVSSPNIIDAIASILIFGGVPSFLPGSIIKIAANIAVAFANSSKWLKKKEVTRSV